MAQGMSVTVGPADRVQWEYGAASHVAPVAPLYPPFVQRSRNPVATRGARRGFPLDSTLASLLAAQVRHLQPRTKGREPRLPIRAGWRVFLRCIWTMRRAEATN